MDKLAAAWNGIKNGLLIGAIIFAAIYCHLYQREREAREAQEAVKVGLPPDVLAKYTMENRRLIQLVRDLDGQVKRITRYVPDEGGFEVVVKKQEEALKRYKDLMDRLEKATTKEEQEKIRKEMEKEKQNMEQGPDVKIHDWGLTSRFGYGMTFSPGSRLGIITGGGDQFHVPLSPQLDWKFFFWRRYSALLQVNMFYPGIELTRHVDDFTPKWLHMNNIELGVSGGPGWRGGRFVGLNVRSNF